MRNQNTPPNEIAGQQLRLPIEDAPPKVRLHGYSDAHERPRVGQVRRGRIVGSFRVMPAEAWGYRYLELNPANASSVLVLDCDDPETLLRVFPPFGGPSELPQPNWISWNPKNHHGHVAYCLALSVQRNCASRRAPQTLLAAIADAYAARLDADDGYTGILSRNPMSRPHRGAARTSWGRRKGYELAELAEPLGGLDGLKPPSVETARTAEGRNCVTFEASMRWAGSRKNLGKPVLPVAVATNKQFSRPMGFREVRGVARSVERYRAEWIDEGRFWALDSESQRAFALRGVEVRRKRVAERDAAIIEARKSTGATHRELGEAFNLHHATVGRILRRAGS